MRADDRRKMKSRFRHLTPCGKRDHGAETEVCPDSPSQPSPGQTSPDAEIKVWRYPGEEKAAPWLRAGETTANGRFPALPSRSPAGGTEVPGFLEEETGARAEVSPAYRRRKLDPAGEKRVSAQDSRRRSAISPMCRKPPRHHPFLRADLKQSDHGKETGAFCLCLLPNFHRRYRKENFQTGYSCLRLLFPTDAINGLGCSRLHLGGFI